MTGQKTDFQELQLINTDSCFDENGEYRLDVMEDNIDGDPTDRITERFENTKSLKNFLIARVSSFSSRSGT